MDPVLELLTLLCCSSVYQELLVSATFLSEYTFLGAGLIFFGAHAFGIASLIPYHMRQLRESINAFEA